MKPQLFRLNQLLFFTVLLTVVLYYGRQILIPLSFAALLAMLMTPVCRRLDKRLHRITSCIICILILLLVFLLVLGIIMGQLSGFIRDLPMFEQKADELLVSAKTYIEQKFDIPVDQQTAVLKNETKNMSRSIGNYFRGLLQSSLRLLAGLAITLAFTFLMLLQKEKYYAFFLKFASGETSAEKEAMLDKIVLVARHYLTGRAISILVLFVLYLITLLALGIEGAFMLSALAALVNIIPYIGPILAAVFPCIVAMVSEDTLQPVIWLIIIFSVIQGIDNYFVTPYFLGGEVSLTALATIVMIICGGFLWGIAGMILFIPMLSIAKIIFDHTPSLKHYSMLIGDEGRRPSSKLKDWFRRLTGKR